MKKTMIRVACIAVIGLMAASCKSGVCSCVGSRADGTPIMEQAEIKGFTASMNCQEIKDKYPNAQIQCFEDKRLEDIVK